MKTCLSVLLSVCLLLTLLPIGGLTASAQATDTLAFSVTSMASAVGDLVTLNVTVPDDHYLVNGDVLVHYDAAVLEAQADASGSYVAVNEAFFANTFYVDRQVSPGLLRFAFAKSTKGSAQGGTMFSITFKIVADAACSTSVTLTAEELYANNGDEDYGVTLTQNGGTVTVTDTPLTTVTNRTMQGDYVDFAISSATAKAGDTVVLDLSVSQNSYISNGQLLILYDPDCLEIQKVCDDEDNPYFETYNTSVFKSSTMWAFAVPKAGQAKFAFASSSSKGATAGGVLFSLTFKVKDGWAGKTDVVLAIPEMSSKNGVIQAGNAYNTNCALHTVGSVTAKPTLKPPVGDLNGNGQLDMFDALMLYGFVSGQSMLTDEQWPYADVTFDGNINIMDTMILFRAASGYAV